MGYSRVGLACGWGHGDLVLADEPQEVGPLDAEDPSGAAPVPACGDESLGEESHLELAHLPVIERGRALGPVGVP